MNPAGNKGWHSRGYLPHYDSPEIIQHIVFRTLDSLPTSVVDCLSDDPAKRRTQVDEYLDRSTGERALADPLCATIVQDCLKRADAQGYHLLGWCIMPNHAHVLIEQRQGHSLGEIVKIWKMTTTHAINIAFARKGRFWALDYFDRFMRDERHFAQTLAYIENSPVKAGLIEKPEDWRFSSASCRGER